MTLKLCYIDNGKAFFTTQEVVSQWGDDWNDVPYEHNAEDPYKWTEWDNTQGRTEWTIEKIYYEHPFYQTPGELTYAICQYSVQMINAGAVAWLDIPSYFGGYGPTPPPIMAGTTIEDFKRIIKETGGRIYALEP